MYILNPGQSGAIDIKCLEGNTICYGARVAGGTGYWGIDIDRSESCTGCCYTCSETSVSFTLTCNL